VVIGSENHGKSTLLERLIGFPIFPRNRTLCTRCPIRVKLRRHTASISSICIRNRETNVIEEGSLAPLALGMMSSHVQSLMDQMLQVYIFLCIYIYIYTYICIYVSIYICLLTCISICKYTHIFIDMYISIYAYM
jgi:GTPase SAR1 family protein